MQGALIELPILGCFACVERFSDRIPDETTILTSFHLLEKHQLGERTYEKGKYHILWDMTMRLGRIVDVILIAAPSSTSTRAGPSAPESKEQSREA
jgi:hypothetical protein